MTYAHMADAAYAPNIPPGFEVVAGYYGGPETYHQWAPRDWSLFPGYKLPIWVGGLGAPEEAHQAVAELQALGVPPGSLTVADMETRVDKTYLEKFWAILNEAGYKVWVYGSASTLFSNPPLNGYWVADYTNNMTLIFNLMQAPSVRAVQYSADMPPGYDASLVKVWTEGEMWK